MITTACHNSVHKICSKLSSHCKCHSADPNPSKLKMQHFTRRNLFHASQPRKKTKTLDDKLTTWSTYTFKKKKKNSTHWLTWQYCLLYSYFLFSVRWVIQLNLLFAFKNMQLKNLTSVTPMKNPLCMNKLICINGRGYKKTFTSHEQLIWDCFWKKKKKQLTRQETTDEINEMVFNSCYF